MHLLSLFMCVPEIIRVQKKCGSCNFTVITAFKVSKNLCDQCFKMTTGQGSPYIATVELLHRNEFAYLKSRAVIILITYDIIVLIK